MQVTFAGSPDRVEARLVPEAGYAFDTFRVSGFPRAAGARARARLAARRRGAAACGDPRAAAADVVLGGGGYVAGPMVLAAWRRRIPAALTEADAHLGLANRLAAPFARPRLPRVPDRRAARPEVPRRRPADPASSRPVPRDEARRASVCPPTGRCWSSSAALAAHAALNETAVAALGDEGPAVLHLSGERDYEALHGRVTRDDYRLLPFTERFGAALSAADLVVCARGRDGLGDRGRRHSRDARSVPPRDRRPPGAERELLRARRRRGRRAGRGARAVPRSSTPLLVDPRAARGDARGDAAAAKPDAADEIAEELVELAAARR